MHKITRRRAVAAILTRVAAAPAALAQAESTAQKITVATPPGATNDVLLDTLQHKAFAFFWNESHADTGLTKDRARNFDDPDTFDVASTASTGYALAALPIGVERGWVTRNAAQERALQTLRTVYDKLPSNHGFFYHFIHWKTGARVWNSELSTIDTALLLLGALTAGQYFKGEVERLANAVYARTDWQWMQKADGSQPDVKTLAHGWKPEEGFLKSRWAVYDEAAYLYLLAMGAPQKAIGADAWNQWKVEPAIAENYRVFRGANPIFWAQMTPGYYDLRGLRDRQGRDWWNNWLNEHLVNRAYCARNAEKIKTYEGGVWGLTACDAPDGYRAYAPRDGANDGTVAPTAALGSFYIAPGLAHVALRTLYDKHGSKIWGKYGFSNAFNVDRNWYDKDVIGIDLGMMLLSIENHRSGLIWRLMRSHPSYKKGLAAAGMA